MDPPKRQTVSWALTWSVGILVVIVLYAEFGDRVFPPRGTTRYNGRLYRARDQSNIPRLETLRNVSLRILEKAPRSWNRSYAIWRIDRCIFSERAEGATSYLALTIDKGRELEICLDYEDENTLRFVLIHELAHVYTRSVGHTPDFYRHMDILLDSARLQGLYTSNGKQRVTFCGSHIDVK